MRPKSKVYHPATDPLRYFRKQDAAATQQRGKCFTLVLIQAHQRRLLQATYPGPCARLIWGPGAASSLGRFIPKDGVPGSAQPLGSLVLRTALTANLQRKQRANSVKQDSRTSGSLTTQGSPICAKRMADHLLTRGLPHAPQERRQAPKEEGRGGECPQPLPFQGEQHHEIAIQEPNRILFRFGVRS